MFASLNKDLVISVGIIFLTSVIGRFSRKAVDSFKVSEFHRKLVLEVIATFELCANCFELGVVIENHGFLIYTFFMLFLFNYWGQAWGSASASVCSQLLSIFEKQSDLKSAVLAISSQALGASVVYQFYVKPVWRFGFREAHINALTQIDCLTHLQVSPIQGAIVEAVATFTFLTAAKTFGPKRYGFITVPLILVSIIYAAIGYSGGYMNPILATTVQFGCRGITLSDHLLVYWLAPAVGALLHLFTWNAVYPTKRVKLH